MKLPRPYKLLLCRCSDGAEHLLTWSEERSFFEPITNVSAATVGLTISSWSYFEETTS